MSAKPDSPFDPGGFAEEWWALNRRHDIFEDHLLCAGDEGFDFGRTWTDDYDSSVEIGEVPPAARLNEAQQRLLADCGFLIAFVNHSDGTETHYNLREVPTQGWRRKRTETGFVVSSWPENVQRTNITVDPDL